MRKSSPRVLALVCSLAFANTGLAAPQTSPPTETPQATLQRSLAALVGNTSLSDITLSGAARRIAGSDDEAGTAVLKMTSSGGTRLSCSYPSGSIVEVRSVTADGPIGAWTGVDGKVHPVPFQNLSTDWGLVPAFTISTALAVQNAVVAVVGTETREGQSVLHIRTWQQFPGIPSSSALLLQHLSQTDIFLDAASLLPASVTFNTHPNDDAGKDIPVEIRFSDYRTVHGAQVPFHVQKFLNNGLVLDLQFQSVSLNSGISAAEFSF